MRRLLHAAAIALASAQLCGRCRSEAACWVERRARLAAASHPPSIVGPPTAVMVVTRSAALLAPVRHDEDWTARSLHARFACV